MSSVRKILFATVLLLSGCATTGPGGKKSFIVIPTSQEVAIGRQMAEQIEATETIFPDEEWQLYLSEVGNRIVRVSDRKDIRYHFTVIESDQINAFAAPGGYVYFYTGLLREMKSESEMAAVMAHEISHVVGRHGSKRLQKALGVSIAYQLIFGDDGSEALQAAVGAGMGLLFAGYSRDAEREADRFGVEYMVKAGYDPKGMIDMFATLSRLGGEGTPNVFEKLSSSHPESKERIVNTKNRLNAMKPLPGSLKSGSDRYQKMLRRLPQKKGK